MAYSDATFQAFLDAKSYVSAFEYAASWEKGEDMDLAMQYLTSNTSTSSGARFLGFSFTLNTNT